MRYTSKFPAKILLEDDIDKTKMANIEKIEEEAAKQNRYMTAAERAKAEGKVIGNYHSGPKSTYRKYYDEDVLENEVDPIIYIVNDTFAERLFRDAPYSGGDNFNIIGFSKENFKRFYKLDNVTVLSDALYKIEFGVLTFTRLGMSLLGDTLKRQVKENFTQNKERVNIRNSPYNFLEDCFATTNIEQSKHSRNVDELVSRYKRRQSEYLTKKDENTRKKF
jgi:hypothetical protein